MKRISLIFCLLPAIVACDKYDLSTPKVTIQAPSTVQVGEEVTFTIRHNAQILTIYTGDQGHEYRYSAEHLLKGKTEQELKDNIYRREKPGMEAIVYDFNEFEPNTLDLPANRFNICNQNGVSIMGDDEDAQAQIVREGERNVLRFRCLTTSFANRRILLYPNTVLGEDKSVRIRLRFDNPIVQGPGASAGLRIVTMLQGIAVGETTPLPALDFYDPSIGNQFCTFPQSEYYDFSYPIQAHIERWQTNYGKEFGTLTGLRIQIGNANGYVDSNMFVEYITVGGKEYLPFDTGKALSVTSDSGIMTHTYTYQQPGNYVVTVIGINMGWKKYSGKGYINERGSNINGNEYDYAVTYSNFNITVEP